MTVQIPRRTALLALLPAGCTTPPPPAVVTIEVEGTAGQNADAGGQGRPVALQVYLLNATARFERADVFALTERDRDTLGPDSAGSEQFVIGPRERRTITREPRAGVQAIGFVALFRDVDTGARWRAVVPIATSGPTRLRVRLERNVLVAEPA